MPDVSNSIFWGDSPDEIADSISEPTITYSDIQGGYDGTGNINADPLFVDPGSDYHLSPDSLCIDAGTNNALNLPDFDFEGNPRIMDSDGNGIAIVEMGIDELFGYALYLPQVSSGH